MNISLFMCNDVTRTDDDDDDDDDDKDVKDVKMMMMLMLMMMRRRRMKEMVMMMIKTVMMSCDDDDDDNDENMVTMMLMMIMIDGVGDMNYQGGYWQLRCEILLKSASTYFLWLSKMINKMEHNKLKQYFFFNILSNKMSCCGPVDKTTDSQLLGPWFKCAGSGSTLGQCTLS